MNQTHNEDYKLKSIIYSVFIQLVFHFDFSNRRRVWLPFFTWCTCVRSYRQRCVCFSPTNSRKLFASSLCIARFLREYLF